MGSLPPRTSPFCGYRHRTRSRDGGSGRLLALAGRSHAAHGRETVPKQPGGQGPAGLARTTSTRDRMTHETAQASTADADSHTDR